MAVFNANGLKLVYPDMFKKKGDFTGISPIVELKNPKTKSTIMIYIDLPHVTFNQLYLTSYKANAHDKDMGNAEFKVIRFGDYPKFFGAKELLTKRTVKCNGDAIWFWGILIPVGDRVAEISVIEKNAEADLKVWKSIIDSIEFTVGQSSGSQEHGRDPKRADWTGSFFLKKYKHLNHTFHPEHAVINLYDSGVELNPELFDPNISVSKINGQITAIFSDVLDIETDLYLCKNNKLPVEPDDAWESIFEGVMAVPSGKLYLTAEMLPEVEILMKPVTYGFRVFIGCVDPENEMQKCRVYFWETNEQETNDIKVIKQPK